MSGKGRSFTPAMNDRLREVAKELRRNYKSDRAFARALGVAQPTVTNFLNGGNAGIQLAAVIAQAAGLTLIVERGGVRLGDVAVIMPAELWRDLAGWDEAITEARRLFPRISDAAWLWLGSLSGPCLPGLPAVPLAILAGAFDQVPSSSSLDDARRPTRSGVQRRGVR